MNHLFRHAMRLLLVILSMLVIASTAMAQEARDTLPNTAPVVERSTQIESEEPGEIKSPDTCAAWITYLPQHMFQDGLFIVRYDLYMEVDDPNDPARVITQVEHYNREWDVIHENQYLIGATGTYHGRFTQTIEHTGRIRFVIMAGQHNEVHCHTSSEEVMVHTINTSLFIPGTF